VAQESKAVMKNPNLQKKRKNLQSLISSVKKNVDVLNLNVALSQSQSMVYTPHLRLVVEPKPFKNNELKIQGTFSF
jgi:hypothetical protein